MPAFAESISDFTFICSKTLMCAVVIYRLQDLEELGELSPHWDNLRKEVVMRYGGIISSYQETLAELEKISGMEI